MKLTTVALSFFLFSLTNLSALKQVKGHEESENYQIIQPQDVASNYQVLKLTDEILRKNGITYWVWGGTLLGAARHGGFIPWDLDTDICIYKDDYEKLLACRDEFSQYETYILMECPSFCRIKRIKDGRDIYGHVDVSIMDETEEGTVEVIGRYYKTHYFFQPEVQNLTRIKFGPIWINAPKIYLPYLHRGYGTDVMLVAEIMYTNNPKTGVPYEKFRLTNFRPAIYEVIDFSIPLDETPLFP